MHCKRLHSSGVLVHPLAVRRSPTDEFLCGVPDAICCAVLLGNSVVYWVCGFRGCSRVWDSSISPRPLCDFALGGCSIEQQEETGQALFFPLATGLCFDNQSIRKINRYMLVITNKYTIL